MRTRTRGSDGKQCWLGLLALGAILAASAGPAQARSHAPRAPSGGDGVRVTTPLHDLSVGRANRILLPLYNKRVEVLLRSGASRIGTLIDIRVGYVLLRISASQKIRIQRRQIVRVTPSTKRAPAVSSAAGGQANAARLQKNTATLQRVVGRTVRLRLDSGRLVDGVVRAVGAVNVTLETDAGSVEVPLSSVNLVLVARRRRVRRAPEPREDRSDPPSIRASSAAAVARDYGGRQPISPAFHRSLLLKYQDIQESGARLRTWGLGLWITGMVLNTLGGILLGTSGDGGGATAGLALSVIGGVIDVPGVIMAIWGHCRYNRGMDMVTRIHLHQ